MTRRPGRRRARRPGPGSTITASVSSSARSSCEGSPLRGLSPSAGASDETLPAPATHRPNSLGASAWAGVKPPAGTGVHRLVVCVTALRVPHLEVPASASPALAQTTMIEHTLGRAVAVANSQAPPA